MISVIVPVYNVESFLVESINSIKNQTYKDIEIILVDDGSTDNSGNICDELAKTDCRIKVYHKENGGLSDARNYGIDRMNGEYVCFIDSDDTVSSHYIEYLYDALKQTGTRLAMCRFKKVSVAGYCEYQTYNFSCTIQTSHQTLMDIYSNNDNEQTIVAVGKLSERSLFDNLRFPKGRIHEDEALTPMLFSRAESIAIVDLPLYFYYVREGSITQSGWNNKRLDYLTALEERIELAKEINDVDFLDETYIKICRFISTSFANIKDKETKTRLSKVFNDNIKLCKFNRYYFSGIRKIALKHSLHNPMIYRYIDKILRILKSGQIYEH